MLDQVVDQDHQKLLLHEEDIHLDLHTHLVDHHDHHIVDHKLHMEQVLDLQVQVRLQDLVLLTHHLHVLEVLHIRLHDHHTVAHRLHTVQADQALHRVDIRLHQDLQDIVLEVLLIHQLLREVDTLQEDHLHTVDRVEVTLQVDEVDIVLAEVIHQEVVVDTHLADEEDLAEDVEVHEVVDEVSILT